MPGVDAYGLRVGTLPRGARNSIADVPGVRVGHATIDEQAHKTGVTVVMPCADNPFSAMLPAAAFVLNGFGKSTGLVQVAELGTLETPIALTNTLNVGLVHDALVEYMLARCRSEGFEVTSINPVVCECNDATLNRIAERAVRREHVLQAIECADAYFAEGDVGGGKGLSCHGLKGGIGSASRLIRVDGRDYALGVLVQSNHGRLADFQIGGQPVGARIAARLPANERPDQGSCIVVAATDLPLSDRQIGRVLRRAGVGLARLGSYVGHGSGEVFVGFSTANRVERARQGGVYPALRVGEERLDDAFRAIAEATEEAVLRSMTMASAVQGADGLTRRSLAEFLPDALTDPSGECHGRMF